MTVQRKTPKRGAEGTATVSLVDLAQLLRGVKPEAMKETAVRVRILIRGRVEQDLVLLLHPGHMAYAETYNADVRCEVSLDGPRR